MYILWHRYPPMLSKPVYLSISHPVFSVGYCVLAAASWYGLRTERHIADRRNCCPSFACAWLLRIVSIAHCLSAWSYSLRWQYLRSFSRCSRSHGCLFSFQWFYSLWLATCHIPSSLYIVRLGAILRIGYFCESSLYRLFSCQRCCASHHNLRCRMHGPYLPVYISPY